MKSTAIFKKVEKVLNQYTLLYSYCLGFFFLILMDFFPNLSGGLGHDYAYVLPRLYDGAIWQQVNGWFQTPWFTPSFGGGLPAFPNPNVTYYTIPQWLSFFIDPLTSVKISIFLFGALGYLGFYLMMRKIFGLSKIVSLFTATLFLLNGTYMHRMIVGHLNFHPTMLTPYLILFTLDQNKSKIVKIVRIIFIGVIFAYMIYGAAFPVVPAVFLAILVVALIASLKPNLINPKQFLIKLGGGLIVGFMFVAAKLNAAHTFSSLFNRELYPLAGMNKFGDLLSLTFHALFFEAPSFDKIKDGFVNLQFQLNRHEFEYGVGLIVFLILGIGAVLLLKRFLLENSFRKLAYKNSLRLIVIGFILITPLALNYYTPSWNTFLKSLPFIKSSFSNFRWMYLYVPILILLSGLLVEKLSFLNKHKASICIVGIIWTILANLNLNRDYYHQQTYDPLPILNAYERLKNDEAFSPEITEIGNKALIENRMVSSHNLIAVGQSNLLPYEPIFGYRLEAFPKKQLVTGMVMQSFTEGLLNLKNPALYVFPEENNGKPGDHFTIDQKEMAEQFRQYKPIAFKISQRQQAANYLTLVSLSLALLFLMYAAIRSLINRSMLC